MRLKITRTNGEILEVEGTEEECLKFAQIPVQPFYVPYIQDPTYIPTVNPVDHYWPEAWITWDKINIPGSDLA